MEEKEGCHPSSWKFAFDEHGKTMAIQYAHDQARDREMVLKVAIHRPEMNY